MDKDAIVADHMHSAVTRSSEVYAVEEGPIRGVLTRLNDDFGRVRAWAARHGIGRLMVREFERDPILEA